MTWILIVFGKSLSLFLYGKVETRKLNNHRPPAPNSPTAPAAVTNCFLGALARNKNRATLFVDLLDPLTQTQLHVSYTSAPPAAPAGQTPQVALESELGNLMLVSKPLLQNFDNAGRFFPAIWKISHSEHVFEIQFRSSAVILWIIQVSNFQQSYFSLSLMDSKRRYLWSLGSVYQASLPFTTSLNTTRLYFHL